MIRSILVVLTFLMPATVCAGNIFFENTASQTRREIRPRRFNRKLDQPLLKAAQAGQTSKVKTLLAKGADPNAANNDGNSFTALMLAAREGHSEVVKILLRAGANANAEAWVLVGASGASLVNMTPLMKAASGGDKTTIELLLKHGADVNAQNIYIPSIFETPVRKLRSSPVLWYSTDSQVLRLLLDSGGNPNRTDQDGSTLLMHAAQSNETPGGIDFVKVLLEKGADVNLRNKQGKTALTLAQEKGLVETAEPLKRAGAKP